MMKECILPLRYMFLLVLITIFLYVSLFMLAFKSTTYVYRMENKGEDSFTNEDIYLPEPKIKLPNHNQEDPHLILYLFSMMIFPSSEKRINSLRVNKLETYQDQGRVIRLLTNYKTEGFFVECGTSDREFFSNTLFLEEHLGWTGLLIEANHKHHKALLKVHRRSWIAPACVSLNTSAYESHFESSSYFLGKVLEESKYNSHKVICFPFYTYMLALDITTIDYFSLDVEGYEIEVLDTIPFDKISITIVSVNFSKSQGGLLGIKSAMENRGYKLVTEVSPDNLIFVKRNHVFSQNQMPVL